MARFELPAGLEKADPRRARRLQALASEGRLHSERFMDAATGRERVKLYKNVDEAVLVPMIQPAELEGGSFENTRLVWPEQENRHRLVTERELAWQEFVEAETGRPPDGFYVNERDPESFRPQDAAELGLLRSRFYVEYPEWAPEAEG